MFLVSVFGTKKADAFIYAPCCLSATAVSQTEIDLTWVAVSADPAATGYTLERESPIGGGFTTIVANSNITSYKDTTLSPNTTYNYRVSAINSAGAGPASQSAAATTFQLVSATPPERPTNLKAVAVGPTEIDISWTAPASASAITGYRIEKEAPYGSGFNIFISNTNSAATTYADTTLTPGVAYNYRVTAINQYGVSLISLPADATTPTRPDAPRNLKVSSGDGKLLASWDSPLFLGGGITGYKIATLETTSTITNNSSTQLSAVIDGLTNGITYTVSVRAYNVAGDGPIILATPIAPVKSIVVATTTTPTASTPSTSAPTTSLSVYKFNIPLYRGIRNKDVAELQKILIAKNFLVSEPTGYFGALTESAVRSYQKANGISQTGTIGPLTRASLNSGK